MAVRKVCIVITARPSYSRIKTALEGVKSHPDLQLQLVVAASALLDRYGMAARVIEEDGFKIDAKVFNVVEGGNLMAQAKTTGLGIIELSNIFSQLAPDLVVTIADRYETMATAIAASYMNIPLVHVQGGEVSGNIDEKVRHAITKLSDLHLVATRQAEERLIKMGEAPSRIHWTGCPSIDLARQVYHASALDFDPYQKYGGVGSKPAFDDGYLVVLQHPVTHEHLAARENIEETLHAISTLDKPTFWFWPNVDAGTDGTSRGIRGFREKYNPDSVHFFKNMRPNDFLKLLANTKCLIGNSSVALRECAYLGVPVVNIGTRQQGRAKAENVMDVGYDQAEILDAIQVQTSRGKFASSDLYGDGEAGERIAQILAKHSLSSMKQLTY